MRVKLHKKKAKKDDTNKELSVIEFFSKLKGATNQLVLATDKASGYEKALVSAKKAGQRALVNKLVRGFYDYRIDTQLCFGGITKYLTEATIIEFAEASERGLRLDWLSDFTRLLPENVASMKAQLDNLMIFDNYAVLHYSPKGENVEEGSQDKVNAEVEKAKDPILFGLIKDRRILYYVADWVDEHCDLTLDKLVSVMGRDVIKNVANIENLLED